MSLRKRRWICPGPAAGEFQFQVVDRGFFPLETERYPQAAAAKEALYQPVIESWVALGDL